MGLRQCHEIDDGIVLEAQSTIFKPGAKASYINRHLHTPVTAILRMALRERAPMLTRPVGHKDVTPIAIPNVQWFRLVAPHMTPVTVALIWFLTVHGRRLGAALGRVPVDFDPAAGTLTVGRAKDGKPILINLHPAVVSAFLRMPDWQSHRWLFRDGPRSGNNVRRDILIACLKANGLDPKLATKPSEARVALKGAPVPYFATHALGRHSAATRALLDGYTLLHVQRMFGWTTIDLVARRYGHLAKEETTAAVHRVGDTFFKTVSTGCGGKVGKVPPPQPLKSSGFLKKKPLKLLPARL
jgi:integrase